MRHFFRRGVICFLIISACAPAAQADDLRASGNRLFLPIEINGHAVEALLDSGAEMTLIDAAMARKLELEASGSAEARGTGEGTEEVQFVQGVEIAAAGITLRNRTVAVLDLSDVSKRLVGEPLHAILGRELFDAGRFRLNIDEGQFRRVPKDATPKGVRLPLRDHRGIKQFPIRIEGGKKIWADFDLGNGSDMLIGRGYAEANGLLSDDRVTGIREGGGIGGSLVRKVVRLSRVEIAGSVLRNVEAAIDPAEDAPDANVGVALLRKFEITVDFAENAVWLEAVNGKE